MQSEGMKGTVASARGDNDLLQGELPPAQRGEEGTDLIPGQGLQILREDADGGVGTPGALLCPADVWHFTK